MASGEVRKVTREDIQLVFCRPTFLKGGIVKNNDKVELAPSYCIVGFSGQRHLVLCICDLAICYLDHKAVELNHPKVQDLIERCLQLYMSQKEVVTTLLHQAKIEPDFTELVWQKLEEENQEFFRAYHLRLIVKDQISRFNELLERQVELMSQICPTGIASIPMSNGSQILSMNHNTVCRAPEHTVGICKTETMHQDVSTSLHHTYDNGASSLPQGITTTIDFSAHAQRIDVPPNMLLAQNSNVGIMQGMNGGVIKSEAGYAGNTPFMFGPNGNVLEPRPAVGDVSLSSYNNTESNAQPLNETILDPETTPFGFLGQIPRNFSLSDLTADFSNSSDIILESYSRSPFLAADPNSFQDPRGRGEHQGSIAP